MNKNPYQPKLTFVGDHFAGRVYELTQEKTTVGRNKGIQPRPVHPLMQEPAVQASQPAVALPFSYL